MSQLTELITQSIDNNFKDSDLKEQTLLYSLAMRKILSLPYYKDIYYNTSVAYIDNDTYGLHLNECTDVGPYMLYRTLLSNEKNILNNEEEGIYSSGQRYFLENSVIQRLDKFKDIVKNNTNIFDYIDEIIKEQNSDKDFLPTLHSYSYLFENFEKNFFNDDIKNIINKKQKIETIDSYLCKNNVYFYTYGPQNSLEEAIELWECNESSRNTSIENSQLYYTSISNIYSENEEKLNVIFDDVKKEKAYLFKSIEEQNLKFYYLEIQGWYNQTEEFKLENADNLSFSQELLNKNNINISPTHYITDSNNRDWYYSFADEMEEKTKDFLVDFSNDLTDEIPPRFFGLDYLTRKLITQNKVSTGYLIARNEDETVGFLSIDSTEAGNQSIIKSINSVCVKQNFRGTGLSYQLYDVMANMMEEQGNILINTYYSNEGKEKLPKLKERVMNNHPNLLNITGAYYNNKNNSKAEQEKQDLITDFNSEFISQILKSESSNLKDFKKNIPNIKSIYKEGIQYIHDNYNVDKNSNTIFFKNVSNSCSRVNKIFEKRTLKHKI